MRALPLISDNLTQKMRLVVKLKQLGKKYPLILIIFGGCYFYVRYVQCYKLMVRVRNKILKAYIILLFIILLLLYIFFMLLQQKKILPFVYVMKEKVKQRKILCTVNVDTAKWCITQKQLRGSKICKFKKWIRMIKWEPLAVKTDLIFKKSISIWVVPFLRLLTRVWNGSSLIAALRPTHRAPSLTFIPPNTCKKLLLSISKAFTSA